MSTVQPQTTNRLPPMPSDRVQEEEMSAEVMTGGSVAEAIGGIATIVLAIIGLAGLFPLALAGVAAIVLGAALLLQGGAVAARFSKLLQETVGTRLTGGQLGGGMSAEFLGGAAGVVLGILALLKIFPLVLLPVAVIVFGGALLMACGTMTSLNELVVERHGFASNVTRRVAADMMGGATGAQALVGLAAIVLGIIGLVGTFSLTLTLVGLLCLGASVVLSGASLGGKMISVLHS
jgi:hypothetical protein